MKGIRADFQRGFFFVQHIRHGWTCCEGGGFEVVLREELREGMCRHTVTATKIIS